MGVGRITSTYRTADQLFIGLSAGEFGGGLNRIDLRTGRIRADWRDPDGELSCDSANSCTPVNGITADPWKPDCIVVAIGLVHMGLSYGRVAEVCGSRMQWLYFKEVGFDGSSPAESAEKARRLGIAPPSVAFLGLAHAGDTLWAVGNDGIYCIGAGGNARFIPPPQFKDAGGIRVSYEVRDFILVLTAINERRSVSGPVPFLVPR